MPQVQRHQDDAADYRVSDRDIEKKLNPFFDEIRQRCTQCGACTKACAFLSRYGTPRAIVGKFDFALPRHQAIAYACSLCGLCTAVCPEKIDPCRLFLEIRRRHVDEGHLDASAYRKILHYERIGRSPLFTWHGVPEGCDTVFFPGCALAGTRPTVTLKLFQHLRQSIPTLGIVLNCCLKPSHDLGRQAHFQRVFAKLLDRLTARRIRTVLTACPSCHAVFRAYGTGLTVAMAYERIHAGADLPGPRGKLGEMAVHDPCGLRDEAGIHQKIRALLTRTGATTTEMDHHGRHTLCCGEGGMVGFVEPVLATQWAGLRAREAGGRPLVVYCAGCAGFLAKANPTIHIADLLFRPQAVLNGRLKIPRAPLTYLNRLWLKLRLKKKFRLSP